MRLLEILMKRQRLGTLVVTELSRLSRGSNPKGFIDNIVFQQGRFISITEGIDTNNKGWEMLVGFKAITNGQAIIETASRVRGAQEGRLLDGNGSAGDFPYGYTSQYRDPAAALRYNGRGPKPCKDVVIEPKSAAVVKEVFRRFGDDAESISAIVKWLELIKDSVPRITKTRIHHQHIRRILGNDKYTGDWIYGIKPDGKKRGPTAHYRELYAKSLLDGLVVCGTCGARLHVMCGDNVKRLGCPTHKLGKCSMTAPVPHRRAQAEIIKILSQQLTDNSGWHNPVHGRIQKGACGNRCRTA